MMTMPYHDVAKPRAVGKTFLSYSLKFLLTTVVLYFVGRQVWQNWDQIGEYRWEIDFLYMIPSILLAQVAFFIFTTCWKKFIGGFGHTVSTPMAFKIFNLSNLGRYIPGKVWQVFGMLYLAKKEGVPEVQAVASFVMVQLFSILASLLVYLVAAQFEPGLLTDQLAIMGRGSTWLIGGVMLAACVALVFYPQPFLNTANAILRKLGRQTAEFALDKKVALLIFVGYFCGWVVFGLAFWMWLRSVLGDSAPSLVAAVGLYNAAYQIGYLAFFAPGGLGPREWVLGLLLGPFVGPIAPALAVFARLWSVLIDSLAAVIALCIRK